MNWKISVFADYCHIAASGESSHIHFHVVSLVPGSRKAHISSLALIFYDYAITFSKEVKHIWKQQLSGTSVLFFLSRYGTIADRMFVILQLFPWKGQTVKVSLLTQFKDRETDNVYEPEVRTEYASVASAIGPCNSKLTHLFGYSHSCTSISWISEILLVMILVVIAGTEHINVQIENQ